MKARRSHTSSEVARGKTEGLSGRSACNSHVMDFTPQSPDLTPIQRLNRLLEPTVCKTPNSCVLLEIFSDDVIASVPKNDLTAHCLFRFL